MEKKIKKKLLLVVSMLAVMFALAGCSLSDKKVEFEYEPDDLAQIAKTQVLSYMDAAADESTYKYISEGDAEGFSELDIEAIEAMATIDDNYGEFIKFDSEYTYEEVEDKVAVKLYAQCADKEAVVKVTFEDNTVNYKYNVNMLKTQVEAQYEAAGTSTEVAEEDIESYIQSQGYYPYAISEIEVSENQTMSDKMKAAGAHTVIGMGIVFIALIFISFIISLLKYVPALFDKDAKAAKKAETEKPVKDEAKKEEPKKAAAPAPKVVDIVNTATGQSAMDDGELVAVITAAIAASEGGRVRNRVNYPSNDKLVVRPRRRNKR